MLLADCLVAWSGYDGQDNGVIYEKLDFTTCLPIKQRYGNSLHMSLQAVLGQLKFSVSGSRSEHIMHTGKH
jgi:hypothetical protein